MPAMIAVVRNREGRADTLHRTFLSRDGDRWVKAQIEKPKKLMPGVRKLKGSAIRLFEVGGVVGIAEGIETALACSKRFQVATWAAISSNIMQSFEPPAGIRCVFIFGDNDINRAGQKAAGKLAERLLSEGYDVKIEISPKPGTDWADLVSKRAAA
jgi:putative DNA primase/helicase